MAVEGGGVGDLGASGTTPDVTFPPTCLGEGGVEPRTEAARRRLGGTGGGYPRESGTSPGLGIQIHDESRLVGSVARCLAMIFTRTPASSSWPSAKCLDFPTSAESRESGRC